MIKIFAALALSCAALFAGSQELYVFSEPASNMPAHSISARVATNYFSGAQSSSGRAGSRISPELMFGLNRKWMLHTGLTFSDMHSAAYRFESVNTYLKYRFFSSDEVHQHFRMAAFLDASWSRSPYEYDDLSLQGDKSGVSLGLIATKLVSRLALSATASHTEILDPSRNDKVYYALARTYQSLNYSLSAGYLLLPHTYTDYRQTNINFYLELLGQKSLDRGSYFWDLAPALQFIFNSNLKLNLGYRFQLNGNMYRMARSNFQLSIERTFLNAWPKRRSSSK